MNSDVPDIFFALNKYVVGEVSVSNLSFSSKFGCMICNTEYK